jgi:hypothetical protein
MFHAAYVQDRLTQFNSTSACPPAKTTETTAPYDLPRGEAMFVTPDVVLDGPARIPDLEPYETLDDRG